VIRQLQSGDSVIREFVFVSLLVMSRRQGVGLSWAYYAHPDDCSFSLLSLSPDRGSDVLPKVASALISVNAVLADFRTADHPRKARSLTQYLSELISISEELGAVLTQ